MYSYATENPNPSSYHRVKEKVHTEPVPWEEPSMSISLQIFWKPVIYSSYVTPFKEVLL